MIKKAEPCVVYFPSPASEREKIADYVQTQSTVEGYGIHQSYWVDVVCFAYVGLFAFIVKGILKRQGIDYDQKTDEDLEPITTSKEGALDVTDN